MTSIAKHLQVGQLVALQEREFGYQITPLTAGQPGQQIVALGPDHIVLEDSAAGVTTQIPCHLLKFATAPQPTAPQAA